MKATYLLTALMMVIHTAALADTIPVAPAERAPTPPQPVVINCQYHTPAGPTPIADATITTWAKNAVIQSFDFVPATIEKQLKDLKNCYTDPGWQGFSEALKKSGNIAAIKAQNLTVSSQVDGTPIIHEAKANQWKITLPLQVVYQNSKEKVTQLLSIDVLIGRKSSGDLGIMQMIATTRKPVPAH